MMEMDRKSELLSFDEDGFELEQHKKTAATQAKSIELAQRGRRKMSVYKILIMLIAIVAAYLLYNAASELIQRYEYNKYHNMSTT